MLDCLLDGLIDTLKIIPFLFISFLIIELLEHKINLDKRIAKSNKLGPLIGGILGIIPQCGFSCVATNLYVTGIITLGTLISVYLSTSDEMLPILISEKASLKLILSIIGIKLAVGIITGFIIDLVNRKNTKTDFSICEESHCDCNHHPFKSAVKHTINISLFIFITNIVLNMVFFLGLEDTLNSLLLSNSIFSPVVTCIVGLIPNCASSVIITKLYLSSSISFGSLIGGLLSNSGVALVVLFKTNKNKKESVLILLLTYFIGVFMGILLNLLGVSV